MRVDCSPNPARLSAAAGVWRENVIWSNSVAVVYHFAVNVNGKFKIWSLSVLYVKRLRLLYHPEGALLSI